MSEREATFERLIEDYDPKQLAKAVKFSEHRFVSIERDALTMNRYVKGHRSLRGACSYLSRTVEEGEPFIPEQVIDLDSGELYELDLIAFVAPVKTDPVGVLLPRVAAEAALNAVNASTAEGPMEQARQLLTRALERRR